MEAPRASSWNWMAPRWEGVRAWPVTKAVMPARWRRGGEWEGEGEGEGEGEEDGVGVGGRRWERGRAMVGWRSGRGGVWARACERRTSGTGGRGRRSAAGASSFAHTLRGGPAEGPPIPPT